MSARLGAGRPEASLVLDLLLTSCVYPDKLTALSGPWLVFSLAKVSCYISATVSLSWVTVPNQELEELLSTL